MPTPTVIYPLWAVSFLHLFFNVCHLYFFATQTHMCVIKKKKLWSTPHAPTLRGSTTWWATFTPSCAIKICRTILINIAFLAIPHLGPHSKGMNPTCVGLHLAPLATQHHVRARLTEGCSFRRKGDRSYCLLLWLVNQKLLRCYYLKSYKLSLLF